MAKIICSLIALLLLSSCATTHRTENYHEASSSFSDSTVQEIRSGVGQSHLNIDSLIQSYLQQSAERQVSRDSTHEQIMESITSYIDSLGREVRTEQRTINRTASSECETFYRQQLTLMQQKYAMQQEHYDSLFQSLSESQKSLKADSISSATKKEVSRPSPLQRIVVPIVLLLMELTFLLCFWLYRKLNSDDCIHSLIDKQMKK